MEKQELVKQEPIKEVTEMTFDEIVAIKKKDLKKLSAKKETKRLKFAQLMAKREKIISELIDLKKDFVESLKDHNMDSVKIKIDILTAEKEEEIVNDLIKTLFPEFSPKED